MSQKRIFPSGIWAKGITWTCALESLRFTWPFVSPVDFSQANVISMVLSSKSMCEINYAIASQLSCWAYWSPSLFVKTPSLFVKKTQNSLDRRRLIFSYTCRKTANDISWLLLPDHGKLLLVRYLSFVTSAFLLNIEFLRNLVFSL